MSIMETKIIQVKNSESVINESNERWGRFGWNVLSIQITHSQDTKTYSNSMTYYTGEHTVETTTINYATITYQRDKGMANYAQIAALEQEYENSAQEIAQLQASTEMWYYPGCFFTICLILLWPLGLAYVAYKIYQTVQMSKREKENAVVIEKLRKRMAEILDEAAGLLVA